MSHDIALINSHPVIFMTYLHRPQIIETAAVFVVHHELPIKFNHNVLPSYLRMTILASLLRLLLRCILHNNLRDNTCLNARIA